VKDSSQSLYRPNVAAVIVSSRYPQTVELFIAERTDIKEVWQFPQGGIDEGETPKEALFRELKEEIGTNNVELLATCPHWVQYDFPKEIASGMEPFIGQRQQYFLVKLLDEAAIDFTTHHPQEFERYQFVALEKIEHYINHFKKEVYEEVLTYFKEQGFL